MRQKTHSARVAARQRDLLRAANEIGPPPPPAHPRRRAAGEKSAKKFLTTYFPHTTGLKPFSADHDTMIDESQRVMTTGGRRVNAIYRGAAKTTISENETIWATITGRRKFALIVGINETASIGNIDSIKRELAENDLLAEDFPEVCHYIRALENKPQKARHQTCNGKPTHIDWRADRIVLPTIPGSKASGAIITAKPFKKARGIKFKRPDGTQARPDLVIIDDPQDDENAKSPAQVQKNLDILRKSILQSTGHGTRMAVLMNATVIAKHDLVETLLIDPAWQGVRVPMVKRWSTAHDTFWLGDYAATRRNFDRTVSGDQARAHAAATILYRKRRAEADAGCVVSWEHIPRHADELSAIQHAYNLLIDDGAEVFASEYQQQPMDATDLNPKALRPELLAQKCNGLERGLIPQECHTLVAGADVHDRLLYWSIVALGDGLRGAVVDYGTWPEQPNRYFTMGGCQRPLESVYAGMTQDAYLLAGLTACTERILGRTYGREDGTPLSVAKLFWDAHWGEKTDLVKAFCRRHPKYHSTVLPSFGVYVKPGDTLRVGRNKKGGRAGPGWGMPPAEAGMTHVTFDANWNKSLLAQRLAAPLGTPGGWDFFGREPAVHSLIFDHCCAERSKEAMLGDARKEVWEWNPNQDNHFWDTLVLCVVAGLYAGVRVPEFARARVRAAKTGRPDRVQYLDI